ncbi:aspartyl-phosphate phosphatase Spo0E family protein [Clostridium sp. WILCCON 0269]|uniref:Aspartyl-phosphate phosphatase Spo0E family protein n=1 Tax=Candidatus Clostridium eludens TaxID=3381663 RepID=A0ABW8ST54_9CLOT
MNEGNKNIDKEIEAVREKLHQYITLYGEQDKRTLQVSEELDELIAKKMKEEKKE